MIAIVYQVYGSDCVRCCHLCINYEQQAFFYKLHFTNCKNIHNKRSYLGSCFVIKHPTMILYRLPRKTGPCPQFTVIFIICMDLNTIYSSLAGWTMWGTRCGWLSSVSSPLCWQFCLALACCFTSECRLLSPSQTPFSFYLVRKIHSWLLSFHTLVLAFSWRCKTSQVIKSVIKVIKVTT